MNFVGMKHSTTMKYEIVRDNPKEFYHQIHRPSHFNNFSDPNGGDEGGYDYDYEDAFE